jgi:hypothetical protein
MVVPQVGLSTVMPVVGGTGSPAACDAAALSASTKVEPALYRTSKLALPEPELSEGLVQVRVALVVVEPEAARVETAAGDWRSCRTMEFPIVPVVPTSSLAWYRTYCVQVVLAAQVTLKAAL